MSFRACDQGMYSDFIDVPSHHDPFYEDGGEGHGDADNMQTAAEAETLERHRKRLADDNYCKRNVSYVWCLPRDYNQEKHPVTCKPTHILEYLISSMLGVHSTTPVGRVGPIVLSAEYSA